VASIEHSGEGAAEGASAPHGAPKLRLPLVLASASPRRRALLAAAGFEFSVAPADIDESVRPGLGPEEAAEDIALQKARTAAERWRGGDALVLGADTIVAVGTDGVDLEYLAKPTDARDAARMLTRLSGSRHRVVTGVAVVLVEGPPGSAPQVTAEAVGHERTWVTMRALTSAEIDAYVASGEWRDRAGGYAIQETAESFVTGLEEGSFDNVVGLPVGLACELLGQLGGA
jgi:septum formation protein